MLNRRFRLGLPQIVERIESAATAAALFNGEDALTLSAQWVPMLEAESDAQTKAALEKLRGFVEATAGPAAAIKPFQAGNWTATHELFTGDIADLYRATRLVGVMPAEVGILKAARDPADNDLIQAEEKALKELHKPVPGTSDLIYTKLIPKLLDSFDLHGRRANVITEFPGCLPMSEIAQRAGTLDFRHVVWMVNRALTILGYVHRRGITHGAITPEHLLFHPGEHTCRLVDWSYSIQHTKSGERIKAIVNRYSVLYPPEVPAKKPAGPPTDLYLLFRCVEMMPTTIPDRFRSLMDYCLAESPVSRPTDAWAVHETWKGLAQQEYGDPKFVVLEV